MDRDKTDPESGKGYALTGFLTGITASIAANIARVYVPPEHAPANWEPRPGAIVAAAFWPVALLLSVEVISRVQWPDGWVWRAIRYGGLTTVAAIAAIISYRHMSGLLTAYGESGINAKIGPLAVDGLMVVSSGALLAIAYNVRQSARADQGDGEARPPIIEATTDGQVRTSETDARRGVARELAPLVAEPGADMPSTALERPSEPVPGGGAARGAFGPEIDATALWEALGELAGDGGLSASKLTAALERRGVAASKRDVQGALRLLRRSEASTNGDGPESESASSTPEPAAIEVQEPKGEVIEPQTASVQSPV